jgi:hypothetical protein
MGLGRYGATRDWIGFRARVEQLLVVFFRFLDRAVAGREMRSSSEARPVRSSLDGAIVHYSVNQL